MLYNILGRCLDMAFGELIRQKRKAKGLTQQKLGELCGYEGRTAETVVQNWEKEKQPVPVYRLRALAKALDLTLDDLIP